MANNNGIELPVSLLIKNLNEIANLMKLFANKNVLADSFGGKRLDSELNKILARLELISAKSKTAFTTLSDFTSVQKDINLVELSLNKVQDTIKNLGFNDLKIPSEFSGLIAALQGRIKELNGSLSTFKGTLKEKLINNVDFMANLQAADPKQAAKWLEKGYDELQAAINDGMNRVNTTLALKAAEYEAKLKVITQNSGKASITQWGALDFIKLAFETLPEDNKLRNAAQNWISDFMKQAENGREFSGFDKGAIGMNRFLKSIKEKFSFSDDLMAEMKARIKELVLALRDAGEKEATAATVVKSMGKNEGLAKLILFGGNANDIELVAKKYANDIKDAQRLLEEKTALEGRSAAFQKVKLAFDVPNEEIKLKTAEIAIALKVPEDALKSFESLVISTATKSPQLTALFLAATREVATLTGTVELGRLKLQSIDNTINKMLGMSNFINRYVGLYAIVRKVTTAVRNAFNNIKELDKAITSIAVVTNMSQLDLWGKIGEYTLMAQQYGVATKDVYEVSQIFYQQGLQTSLVMSMTTESLKMAKIAGIDYSTAANAMTVAVRAFKLEMTEAQSVTDTYSALAAKFAVSSSEIANAMEKTASSAASVGMSLQSTSAFISVMEQTTRESAQNIGSALKSIISRYGEMKASPAKLLNVDGEEVAFNKVDTALASIGISIKDAAGQFRDFDDVIMELASKWDSLDNNTQRYIATIMAGNRQQSRFIALVSNYDELNRAMQTASNAENASIVQVAKTMDSLESKANLVKNAFSLLYLDLHIEEGLKGAYDWLTRVLKTIGKLGTAFGALPTLANIIGFGAGAKSLVSTGVDYLKSQKGKWLVQTEEAQLKIEEVRAKASEDINTKWRVEADLSLLTTLKNALLTELATAINLGNILGNLAYSSYYRAGGRATRELFNLAMAADGGKTLLNLASGSDAEKADAQKNMEAYELASNKVVLLTNSIEQLDTVILGLKSSKDLEKVATDLGISKRELESEVIELAIEAKQLETTTHLLDTTTIEEEKRARLGNTSKIDENSRAFGNHTNQLNDKQGISWKDNEWGNKNAMKIAGVASGVARIVGTGIVAKGAAHLDKSTDNVEISKILTGAGNALSMAGTGASMGMAFGPLGASIGGLIGAAFGGLGAIIDGLHMDLSEKIALLKEEAQKAQDESLKALAKATDMSSQIDNLKLLQEAMYDSTDSMLAYKDAISNMAEQYPELVSSYDSAGNAIINITDAEEALSKVRLEGASAAREAAIKQLETAKTQSDAFKVGAVSPDENLKYLQGYLNLAHSSSNNEDMLSKLESLSSNPEDEMSQWYNRILVEANGRAHNGEIDLTKTIPSKVRAATINSITQWYNLNQSALGLTLSLDDIVGRDNTSGEWTINLIELALDYIAAQELKAKKRVENLNTVANSTTSYETFLTKLDIDSSIKLDLKNLLETTKNYLGFFNELLSLAFKDKNKELAAQGLEQYGNLYDWQTAEGSDYIQFASETYQSFIDWYNSLNDSLKKEFESLDFSEYKDANELITHFNISADLADEFIEQFTKANVANRDRILKTIYDIEDGTVYSEVLNSNLTGLEKLKHSVVTSSIVNPKGEIEEETEDFNRALDIAHKFGIMDKNGEVIEGTLEIISKYADYFTSLLITINDLANDNYTQLANTRLDILSLFATSLASMTSEELRDMFGIVTNTDFGSYDSILSAIKSLEEYAQKNKIDISSNSALKSLYDALGDAASKLLFNVNTLAQEITATITSASKKIDSIIATNKSGLSFDKALEEFTNLSARFSDLGDFDAVFSYDAILGKYVYTQNGLTKAIQAQEEKLNEHVTLLTDTAKLYTDTISLNIEFELGHFDAGKYDNKDDLMRALSVTTGNAKIDEAYLKLAKEYINSLDYVIEGSSDGFVDFVMEQAKNAQIEAEKALIIIEEYKKNKKNQYFQAIDWSKLALGTDFSDNNLFYLELLAGELGITMKGRRKVDVDEKGRAIFEEYTKSYDEVLDEYLSQEFEGQENAEQLIADAKAQIYNLIADSYINDVSKIGNLLAQGTTSQVEMLGFLQAYSNLMDGKTIDFSYNSILKAWTIDTSELKTYLEEVATKLNLGELTSQWIEDLILTLTVDNLDFSSYLSKTASQKDLAKLKQNLKDYFKMHNDDYTPDMGTLEEWAEQRTDNLLASLDKGGQEAVNALKSIKGELTTEEIQNAYRAQIAPIKALYEQIDKLYVGSIVPENQIKALLQAGFKVNADGVVTVVGKLVDAYKSLYELMKETGEATLAEINGALGKYLDNRDNEQQAINALSNATNMTYSLLAEIYTQAGIELTEELVNAMELVGIIKGLGGNKLMIQDFRAFAKLMNWNEGSEEYTKAFAAYNDSLIKYDRLIEKSITEELKNVVAAKPGDKVNLTNLVSKLDEGLDTVLETTGARIENGILTISEGADLADITNLLLAMVPESVELIPDEIAEIADAVNAILQLIASLIKEGINGTLSNANKQSLTSWGNANGLNLQFTQTAEGFKLALESAIQVYYTLKSIDALLGKLVFDELNKSLQETNEHYKSISDVANRIKEIESIPSNARTNLYEQELALAEEIYAVRSTTEDSSFNFMSNKIPGGLNNPINYFNNWAKAIHTFNDALKTKSTYYKGGKSFKSGVVDYDFWYNLVTEMNNIAALGGPITFAGETLDGSLEKASALILKGADALVVTDTGEVKVALNKISTDFKSGADAFSGGVTEGIQALAKSQSKMLDGLIKLLEAVVAMEKLGDIDVRDNKILDLGELFVKTDTGNWKIADENLVIFNAFLEQAGDSLDSIIINGLKFTDLAEKAKVEGLDLAMAENFTAIMNSLYQMYNSGDYNLDNLYNSIQLIMAQSKFTGTVELGDTILHVKNGAVIIETEDNKGKKFQTPNGEVYDTMGEAIARSAIMAQGVKDGVTYKEEVATGNIEIETLGANITITSDKEGNLTFKNGDGEPISAANINDYILTLINERGLEPTEAAKLKTDVDLEIGAVKLNSFNYKSIDSEIREEFEAKLASGSQAEVDEYITLHPVLKQLKGKTGEEIAETLGLASVDVNVKTKVAEESKTLVKEDIESINPQVTVTIPTPDTTPIKLAIKDMGPLSKTVVLVPSMGRIIDDVTQASGNIGLANAKGTLMGELGPELVVSKGRYFIAGLNGPEMVNLADDAIVFNHLQTESLLTKGMSKGRGKAVTNERNAVSFATGNVNGGPAKASASAALATLRQLKAQWDALAGLSAKDLAGKAGGGGGGGGNAAFIKDLERWYNLLQLIATLEQKITYEQSKRAKIQSSFNRSGQEYFNSLKDSLKYLEQEIQKHQLLADELQEYFKKRLAELNKLSAFSELYTFDENGQIQYKSGKFAELSLRFGGDSTTGKPNYTVKEQYDWLISLGYGYAMEYNESGEKIEVKDAKDEAGMKSAIEAFWAKIESDKSEMQGLHDSIDEHKKAVLEKLLALNEILKEIEDNLINVENKVMHAIEDAAKREIDELKDLKDAIKESNEKLIKGLSDLLNLEKQMYATLQAETELESKRRRLAILQRSGASASEISSLLKEIDNDSREQYFNKQQELIDAIQEASDNEIEKLEKLIDLMEETLEYQKLHGLLWERVYEVMNTTPENIASFIQQNDSAYWGKSPADLARNIRDDLFEAEKWLAFAAEGVEIKDYVAKIAKEIVPEGSGSDTSGQGGSGEGGQGDDGSGGSGGGDSSGSTGKDGAGTERYRVNYTVYGFGDHNKQITRTGYGVGNSPSAARSAAERYAKQKMADLGLPRAKYSDAVKYVHGGLADFTGLAQLDGTKSKPEAVLNATLTKILRDNILSNKPNSLISLLHSYNEAYRGLSNSTYDSISNNSNSVVIEHAEVNMHVAKMDNSYDAAKAGDDVMREILNIASKTVARNRII